MQKHDLDFKDVLSATQDTTGSSINVFDEVKVTAQIPCSSHMYQLVLLHSASDSYQLSHTLSSLRKLIGRLKGKNSSKRKIMFQKKCAQANVRYLVPKLPGETRWSSNIVTIEWIMKVWKAVELVTDEDIPLAQGRRKAGRASDDDIVQFSTLKSDVLDNLPLLESVFPLLSLVASWTQILTASHSPTMSLVLTALKTVDLATEHLRLASLSLDGLSSHAMSFYRNFCAQMRVYFGEGYRDFYLYQLAVFLDPQTTFALRMPNVKDILESLKEFCYDEVCLFHTKHRRST